jgi:hypothetical protein
VYSQGTRTLSILNEAIDLTIQSRCWSGLSDRLKFAHSALALSDVLTRDRQSRLSSPLALYYVFNTLFQAGIAIDRPLGEFWADLIEPGSRVGVMEPAVGLIQGALRNHCVEIVPSEKRAVFASNPLPDEDLCVRPGSRSSYWCRLLLC